MQDYWVAHAHIMRQPAPSFQSELVAENKSEPMSMILRAKKTFTQLLSRFPIIVHRKWEMLVKQGFEISPVQLQKYIRSTIAKVALFWIASTWNRVGTCEIIKTSFLTIVHRKREMIVKQGLKISSVLPKKFVCSSIAKCRSVSDFIHLKSCWYMPYHQIGTLEIAFTLGHNRVY